MTPPSDDEFYIGYQKEAPVGLARRLRITARAFLIAAPILTAIVAAAQMPLDRGVCEFGRYHSFEGVLYETPVSLLRVMGPSGAARNYLLVGAGKHGLPNFARGHDGQKVRFRGSLVYRDYMVMVELNNPQSFEVLGAPSPEEQRRTAEVVGPATLRGELVDTKCFFGVMRPATGKVHRACAARCLSGGVPPGLLVRDGDQNGVVCLLAGPEGRSLDVNPQWAALEVIASGRLELQEDTPILRVDALRTATAHD